MADAAATPIALIPSLNANKLAQLLLNAAIPEIAPIIEELKRLPYQAKRVNRGVVNGPTNTTGRTKGTLMPASWVTCAVTLMASSLLGATQQAGESDGSTVVSLPVAT
jgi:hypothetical protein